MPTFTTIVESRPEFNVVAYEITSVIRLVQTSLLATAPRGAKCRTSHELFDKDDEKYRVVTITMQNMKGTVLSTALVIGEQPEESHKVRPIFGGGKLLECQECKATDFYYVDRSLDYENLLCAHCGRSASNLTETGASA